MKALIAFAALPLMLCAFPADAGDHGPDGGQVYYRSQGQVVQGYSRPYGRYGQGGYYGGRYDDSYGDQRDVPGDYRCDAYWDRGRNDCNAGWRDQRGHGYGYNAGYGRQRGRDFYSSQSGRGYGRATTYYGAYGQPDVVYAVPTGGYGPSYGGYSGGYSNGYGGRNQGRIEWCRSAYRSYDPQSGYYRAYSGRLIYCG